eukprot:366150-Chlamydomonas_euryale.AAC.3
MLWAFSRMLGHIRARFGRSNACLDVFVHAFGVLERAWACSCMLWACLQMLGRMFSCLRVLVNARAYSCMVGHACECLRAFVRGRAFLSVLGRVRACFGRACKCMGGAGAKEQPGACWGMLARLARVTGSGRQGATRCVRIAGCLMARVDILVKTRACGIGDGGVEAGRGLGGGRKRHANRSGNLLCCCGSAPAAWRCCPCRTRGCPRLRSPTPWSASS